MTAEPTKATTTRCPKRRVVALIVIGLILASAFGGYWYYAYRPQAFIHQWAGRFRTVNSLDAARQLAESDHCVLLRVLPSGEWFVATCEHSCCSGAGFDATVIRDSTGAIYADTTHTFCGIEGLGGELGERLVSATSLPAVYSNLTFLKLQKQ